MASIRLILVSIACILTSCSEKSLHLHDVINEYESYERLVRESTSEFTREAYKLYGVYCYGEGGAMAYDVEKVHLSLELDKEGRVSDARQLHLKLTQLLLSKLNSNEKLRPYLRSYPMTHERLCLSVYYRDGQGEISGLTLARGKFFYSKNDPTAQRYIAVHEETYEEAERIIAEQDADQKSTGLEVL